MFLSDVGEHAEKVAIFVRRDDDSGRGFRKRPELILGRGLAVQPSSPVETEKNVRTQHADEGDTIVCPEMGPEILAEPQP